MTIAAQGPAATQTGAPRNDLRQWIQLAEELGQLQRIDGAHWDLEIGGLTEMLAFRPDRSAALLFDRIQDYPAGWRVLTNFLDSSSLAAAALSLPRHLSTKELVQAWRDKSPGLVHIPPREVDGGPIFENVQQGADVDLGRFPTPRWHEGDGGRYLGTADLVVTRDPDTGHVNVGTYRMMVQDRDKIGLYISPGHHGRFHREKYFSRGEPMPVVAVFGHDPLLFVGASQGLPVTTDEYAWAGGVRGEPVDVIRGPVTGLPIPAHAEIAIEGYVHPGRLLDEGPFGEWTGYYASAMRKEPYVDVAAVYYRTDPIILGYGPTRPPLQHYHVQNILSRAQIWNALDAAGIPDVKGVSTGRSTSQGLVVVAIRQRYAGHARQAAIVASQARAAAYLGRYIVVVDDDIDPDDMDQVLWAVWTRSDPEESLDLIRNAWSTPLDPRIPPEKRARQEMTNSRLIIDATRPFHWREQFPKVSGLSPELRAQLAQKWSRTLFNGNGH